ncbi:hypothetical protein D3C78_1575280 [compost metagenome]
MVVVCPPVSATVTTLSAPVLLIDWTTAFGSPLSTSLSRTPRPASKPVTWYRFSLTDRSMLNASCSPPVPTSVKSKEALAGSLANRLASKVLVAESPSLSVSVALNASWTSLARLSLC